MAEARGSACVDGRKYPTKWLAIAEYMRNFVSDKPENSTVNQELEKIEGGMIFSIKPMQHDVNAREHVRPKRAGSTASAAICAVRLFI